MRMYAVVFVVVLSALAVAAERESREARCDQAVGAARAVPEGDALRTFCIHMLENVERQRIQNVVHPHMPVRFGRSGELLPIGQVCVANTVTVIGIREGVPFATQLLENLEMVGCEDDHRM